MKYAFVLLVIFLSIITICVGQYDSIPESAAVLSRYVQFQSERFKEEEAGRFFMNECQKKGLHTEILIPEDTGFNFIASLYPLSLNKPNIIFLNHIDVVPPGDSAQWTFPPYSGAINNKSIWGRGSIDNKGMAVSELFAIADFVPYAREDKIPFNISILSVSGEETEGYSGAKFISEKVLSKLNPYLILGEGGSGVKGLIRSNPEQIVFGVSTVEKSKIILCMEMEIPSIGHGSVPPKEYAMKEMIFALEKLLKKKPTIECNRISVKALKTLGRNEKGIQGFVQRHFTFILFKPLVKRTIKKDPVLLSFFANTITFTNMTIPESSDNMISNSTKAVFDCRLLPNQSVDKYIRKLHRWVKDDRIKISVLSTVEAAPATRNPEVFQMLKNSLDKVFLSPITVEMIFPATSDNNYFRNKGIPVYGIFPSCFSEEELMSIHNINERIDFQRLNEAIAVYKSFIEELLKSGVPFHKPSHNNKLLQTNFQVTPK